MAQLEDKNLDKSIVGEKNPTKTIDIEEYIFISFDKLSTYKEEISKYLKNKIGTCLKDGYIMGFDNLKISSLSEIRGTFVRYKISYVLNVFTLRINEKIKLKVKKVTKEYTVLSDAFIEGAIIGKTSLVVGTDVDVSVVGIDYRNNKVLCVCKPIESV